MPGCRVAAQPTRQLAGEAIQPAHEVESYLSSRRVVTVLLVQVPRRPAGIKNVFDVFEDLGHPS